MAKATLVKKARQDYPEHGIKKGESYYWWKFRFGGKHYSKKAPRPSQLTQSDFWTRAYGIQEDAEEVPAFSEIESRIEDLKSQLEELRDEQEEKKSNMPEGLQESASGELLQERYDALDEVITNLDSVDVSCDGDEEDEDWDDKSQERAVEIWSEVSEILSAISCG